MRIRERENELFAKWKRKYESFVVDGAPNPGAFRGSPIRTVIVLKDVNVPDAGQEFDLRGQLATKPHKWWNRVSPWCAGITALPGSLSWAELQQRNLKTALAPFAFIQLKKAPGGGSVGTKTLKRYAREDASEIRAQLEIYEPQVIVGGGSKVASNLVKHVFDTAEKRETERGVRYWTTNNLSSSQSTYVIDYLHPSVRVKKSVVCFGLLDAIREILGAHGLMH